MPTYVVQIEIQATAPQAAAAARIDPAGMIATAPNGRDLLLAVVDTDAVTVHTISPDGGSTKQTGIIDQEGWSGLGPLPSGLLPTRSLGGFRL